MKFMAFIVLMLTVQIARAGCNPCICGMGNGLPPPPECQRAGFVAFSQSLNSQQGFLAALQNFQTYTPTLSQRFIPNAAKLTVQGNWSLVPTQFPAGVAIGSFQNGSWPVQVGGWIARLPSANEDAIDFAICDGLGEALSTQALKPGLDSSLIADDFAVRACLPIIWGNNFSVPRVMSLLPFIQSLKGMKGQKYESFGCHFRAIVAASNKQPISYNICSMN